MARGRSIPGRRSLLRQDGVPRPEVPSWVTGSSSTLDMLQNDQVVAALQAGTLVAIVSAVIGYFVVLRGLSFIGHAVTDIGFTGGAGSRTPGPQRPLGAAGVLRRGRARSGRARRPGARARRGHRRDPGHGPRHGRPVPLYQHALRQQAVHAALRIHLRDRYGYHARDDRDRRRLPAGAVVLFRPLLFCSVSPQVAEARGVPVRMVSALFLVCMAVAVAEAAQVVGVLLSTALLIGPPATAAYLVSRPGSRHDRGRHNRAAGDVGRHRAVVRQLLLAAGRKRLARLLLHLRACAAVLPSGPRRTPAFRRDAATAL